MVTITSGNPLGAKISTSEIEDGSITLQKLADGTAGKVIGFNDSGAPALLGFQGLSFKDEQIVSGSPVTTMSFTGLDINTDGYYFIIIDLKGYTSSGKEYNMYFNGDQTNNHYTTSQNLSSGGAVSHTVVSAPRIGQLGGYPSKGSGWILVTRNEDGYLRYDSNWGWANSTTDAKVAIYNGEKNSTESNLTQIDFKCSVTSGLDVGSRVTIYKIARS